MTNEITSPWFVIMPSSSASVRVALSRFTAPPFPQPVALHCKLAPLKSASVKSTNRSRAPSRIAPCRFAPDKSIPSRFRSDKSEPGPTKNVCDWWVLSPVQPVPGSLGCESPLSPIPSPSVSAVSVGSFGNASALSATPSPSVSVIWYDPLLD